MKKVRKFVDQISNGSRQQSGGREEMELLVSHDPSRNQKGSSVSSRVKFYGSLLAIGLVGTISCLWAMFFTGQSKERIQNLGLHKVANSLENILDLLAYPVLMFTVILAVYAGQQLYKIYQVANDPDTYRKNRSGNSG